MTKVQQMLKDYFPGIEIKKTVNADEAVAQGASILAGYQQGEESLQGMIKVADIDIETIGSEKERQKRVKERETAWKK